MFPNRKSLTALKSELAKAKFTKEQTKFFESLLDSLTLVKENRDSSKYKEPGLVQTASDQDVIDKQPQNKWIDGNTRIVMPHQLPDTVADDSSVVVTELIWNATDGVVVADTSDKSKVYRKRYTVKGNPAITAQYDKFLSISGQTVYTLDGTSGMPNLINRNIQLLVYGTTPLEDLGASPGYTFVSATGVLTFTFSMADVGQITLISTG